ncbi:MAG: ECF RNA polymerase sigma factor SigK [Salinibacterium sp.]|nr:ECF RNA polymerase sigma factor SigK [Salinibacterium sp.]MBF0671978.1 ECF RNA polymerase sigma factor SigK [Salinibacterium sp.]
MLYLVTADPQPDAPVEANAVSALLARVATGDQAAFAQLYDAVAPRVLGLIRRVLVDPAQSEEVAQEVFLEIWQNAPRYDSAKGAAMTWIMTMAHRRAIDRIRSSQSSRDRDEAIGIRDLAGPVDDVAETVATTLEAERVKVAMARLSELQREAVSLAYYGGLTQTEVAERLQVPLGTVKTRIRDGMLRLRTELGVAS